MENMEDIEKNIKEIEDIKEELKPDPKKEMVELIRMVMNEKDQKDKDQKDNTEQKTKLIYQIERYIKIKDKENLLLKPKDKIETLLKILQSNAFKLDPQISLWGELKQNRIYILYIGALTGMSFALGAIIGILGA